MKRLTAFIILIGVALPLFSQSRIPTPRDYRYRQYERDRKAEDKMLRKKRLREQRESWFKKPSRPRQTVIGVMAGGGISGPGSHVVYDPAYPNQTVEYEITPSYSFGAFINLYEGWITEISRNTYEIKHTWYDDHGKIKYSIPVTTIGITTGYRLTWPGFYHIDRKAGNYPFIMAGVGAHWCTSKPEPEVKMELNESADGLDIEEYYGNRLRVDMKQLQGAFTGAIGNEFVLSRHFSIGIGIRATYYLYLYMNSNAEKIQVSVPGEGESARDLGDFSEIAPITVQLFITASVMY